MSILKTLLVIFLFLAILKDVHAADLSRNESIAYMFSTTFSERTTCADESLEELKKLGVTEEQCKNRIKEVRKICPKEAASKLPETIPDEESNKLFQVVFRCFFRIMHNKEEYDGR